MTILVIDDEFDILSALVAVLRHAGYDVVALSNGREGVEYLKTNKPALVITDMMMPYVSGLELLQRLQDMPERRDVPAVLMSCVPPRQALKERGWAAILDKPFDIDRLLEVVERLAGPPPGDALAAQA